MKTEYVVWGIPPLGVKEEILYTLAGSETEAKRACEILAEREGCTACRVQVIDFTENPTDLFKKAVNV